MLAMHVELEPYNPDWPEMYRQEAHAIRARLGKAGVCVEHIGSTAVPGLPAKPIIDILIGLPDGARPDDAVRGILEDPTCIYVSCFEDVMPFRRFFIGWRNPLPPGLPADQIIARADHPVLQDRNRRCHIHLVATSHPFFREHLRFRDLLRENDGLRLAYEKLKRSLALREWHSGADYAKAKGNFIREALG